MAAVDANPDPGINVKMYTDLSQYSHRRSKEGPYADDLDIDVLIVGAGFGILIIASAALGLLMGNRWRVLLEDFERPGLQDSHL